MPCFIRPGGLREALSISGYIEKGLNDARADIGEDLARARGDGEEEELALPEMTIEGVGTFLYDAAGEAVGVEHALFTEDGEPWACTTRRRARRRRRPVARRASWRRTSRLEAGS